MKTTRHHLRFVFVFLGLSLFSCKAQLQDAAQSIQEAVTTPTPFPSPTPFTTPTASPTPTASSSPMPSGSQIIKVGAGEYLTTYVTRQGRLFAAVENNGFTTQDLGLSNIVDAHGGQYHNVVMNSNGEVWSVGPRQSQWVIKINADAGGGLFSGNSKVYGWYQAGLSLKSGRVYMWGEDLLNLNGGSNIPYPVPLVQPTGKFITKLAMASINGKTLLALASDGTVWRYTPQTGNPVQISLPAPARDIAAVDVAGFVAETANDLLAWGYLTNHFGLPNFTATPTSIKAQFVTAGALFPTKELIGNHKTLHLIDQRDELYGMGDNIQGEIGNGRQRAVWRTNTPGAWAWNWNHSQMLEGVSRVPGKFKNLCTSNTITFFHFAQDLGGNWYSWGRNKAAALGNGITLNGSDSSTYPDGLNVPAPTLVTPLSVTWKIWKNASMWGPGTFDPQERHGPIANAGVNQYLPAGTSSTTLYGSGSHQQEGTIASYQWVKLSGPSANIVHSSSMNTAVTGLTSGTYTFQLRVTNSDGISSTQTVQVSVSN